MEIYMKKVKFLIAGIIIAIGFTLIGESFHFYLNNVADGFSYTTLYLQIDTTEEEMKKDILDCAQKHNVDFFVLQRDVKSTFETEFSIYQNAESTQQYLARQYRVYEGDYKSIFSGILKVRFYDYETISDSLLAENHTYYMIGGKDDIHDFKMDLIDKYAGKFPIYSERSNSSRNLVITVWTIIGLLLLLLTGYDILLQQKEVCIRAAYGEPVSSMILKNILTDLSCYAGIFFLCYFFLQQFTIVAFYKEISFCCFGIFLLLNSIQYLKWLFINIKDALTQKTLPTNILYVTYLIKSVTVILTILVVATNMAVISESLEYRTQKGFFEAHKDYFYTNLEYRELTNDDGTPVEYSQVMEESARLRDTFYQKYYDEFNPIILVYLNQNQGRDMILANRNAVDYLLDLFPELQSIVNQEGYYYLVPEDVDDLNALCDSVDLWMEFYEDKNLFKNRKIISYSGSRKVLNINEFVTNGSQYCTNPVIILNNTRPYYDPAAVRANTFKTTYEHDIMYQIDPLLFQQFVEEYGLENQLHVMTNVYEKYEYNWRILKRLLYINLVFSLLMLILESVIIKTIIDLEFKINAMSLSLKKVLGYSYWQRYKQLFLLSTIGCALCVAAGCIIGLLTGQGSTLCIIAGGAIIYLIDMAVMRSAIAKNEKANISNILKGEYV